MERFARTARELILSFTVAFACCLPDAARADVWTVAADGSADFSTVADAVDFATSGDAIHIMPGTYIEAIATTKSLTLEGVAGAGATILSGNGTDRILRLEGTGNFFVRGLTFTAGYHPDTGGAIHARSGSQVTLEQCYFVGNRTDFDGGACHVRNPGSSMYILDCVFEDNVAPHNAGAVNAVLGAKLTIEDSRFLRNSSSWFSGAVSCNDGDLKVRRSVFSRNSGYSIGAVYFWGSTGTVENCTFERNSGREATVLVNNGSNVEFVRNIVFDELLGFGLVASGAATAQVRCNIFWSNARGPYDARDVDEDNQVVDPLFCDPVGPEADLTIWAMSPASPEQSPCGELIGALPVRCDHPIATETRSWGELKSSF